jgi:hypothetical protein
VVLVNDALNRLAAFFAERRTRQGILARAALGRPAADDAALRAALIAQFRAEVRPDGSLGGAAVPTVWRAHELMDLGHGGDQPGTAPILGWGLRPQGRAGAFSDGCTDARHRHRACEHFLAGFFAPAPPEQRLAPVTFPNAKVFRAEPAARFAASCLALRAALRGGHAARPQVEQHVMSLARLRDGFSDWGGYWAPDLAASALHALAASQRVELAAELAAVVAANQSADGTWPGADLFHVLEAVATVPTPEARTALRRAAPALLERQRPDGSFGNTAREERALIALRTLLAA